MPPSQCLSPSAGPLAHCEPSSSGRGGAGAMLTRAAVCGHPASPDGGARPVRTRRLAEALQTHSPAIARGSTVATEQEHAAFHGAASLWCFVMVSDEFSSEANQFSPQLRG